MLLPRLSLLALTFAVLAVPAQAQKWWSSSDSAAEVGKLQELKRNSILAKRRFERAQDNVDVA